MPIKGTTRRVIEVNGTNSCYFEKAVLYVRPECSPIDDSRLAEEAKHYAASLSGYAISEARKRRNLKIQGILIKVTAVLFAFALALGIYAAAISYTRG